MSLADPMSERVDPRPFTLPVFRLRPTNVCSRTYDDHRRSYLPTPRLSKLEFQIMETLWARGELSIREIQESFSPAHMPAYTTIQTTIYRMELKNIVRRVKKVGNFHVFEAVTSRTAAQRRILDDVLGYFGGNTQPVMAHLIESGKLSLDDVKDAERTLRKLARKAEKA